MPDFSSPHLSPPWFPSMITCAGQFSSSDIPLPSSPHQDLTNTYTGARKTSLSVCLRPSVTLLQNASQTGLLLSVSAAISLVQTTDQYSRLSKLKKLPLTHSHTHTRKHTQMPDKMKSKGGSAIRPRLNIGREISSGTRDKKENQNIRSERESKPSEPQEYWARHMLEARW